MLLLGEEDTEHLNDTGWKELPGPVRFGIVVGGTIAAGFIGWQLYKYSVRPKKVKVNWDNIRGVRVLCTELDPNYQGSFMDWCETDTLWTPDALATELHNCMEGINVIRSCADVWADILTLNTDEIRWLHNYWLESIDNVESLRMWIEGEASDWVIPGLGNVPIKTQVLTKMAKAGV